MPKSSRILLEFDVQNIGTYKLHRTIRRLNMQILRWRFTVLRLKMGLGPKYGWIDLMHYYRSGRPYGKSIRGFKKWMKKRSE